MGRTGVVLAIDHSFTCGPSDIYPLLQAVVSALKVKNTTLTSLLLSCESSTPLSSKGKDAILDMLLHNYTLNIFEALRMTPNSMPRKITG
jgi:hypothetical protein